MNSPLFIETIRLSDGVLSNLVYHDLRLNHTRKVFLNQSNVWELGRLIQVPKECQIGLYKCRVTYGLHVENIEFEIYQPRIIQRLRLINDDNIEYNFKYKNRTSLMALFEQRAEADDVVIVKKGLITDASYANIAFWDGSRWVTPDRPLLAGTRRAALIAEGVLVPQKIRAEDLSTFSSARLVNAMLDFQSTPLIEISNISY
ncbi:aminotransferase class IV [Runella sp. MFBS21]|uniref:aminotransferase class IV n=1 Tax=Runella sp. MFBS21 TaxID=3034018 RepID=UPI0023FA4783|nr:aminotransferase class IV [Runella sp. MFBS21]MDF7820289.1 aminotransferase class IV [Runella sp. MFBS21]